MLKKAPMCALLMGAVLLLLQGISFAQAAQAPAQPTVSEQDIQMLRQDLRSQKKQIVAQNLPLSDAQAEKFWPLYDSYTQETIKINDQRYALIKQYAESYNTLTDAQAADLVKRSGAIDQQFTSLRQNWFPKFEKVIGGKQAALFYQLDRRIGLLMDLQLASMIPVVNTGK